jgi:hypothetical protein
MRYGKSIPNLQDQQSVVFAMAAKPSWQPAF